MLDRTFLDREASQLHGYETYIGSSHETCYGISVREVNGGVYIFQFYHAVDMNRILDMSPWSFNNQTLLKEKMGDFENSCDVPLNHMYMWVKVFGLKASFKSESVAPCVKNFSHHVIVESTYLKQTIHV